MTEFILAQFVGFIGYALIAISPRFKERSKVLFYEACGFAFVFLQFVLMGIHVGMCTSFFNIYTAAVAILIMRCPFLAFLKVLGLPMFCGAAAMVYDGSFTFFCAAALIPIFTLAKMSKDIRSFRLLSICAGACWMLFAGLSSVWVSLAFAVLFVYGHASELFKLWRQRADKPSVVLSPCLAQTVS